MAKHNIVWVDFLPMCDIHKFMMGDATVTAKYDAKTTDGRWANLCEPCFKVHTPGKLGTGVGQEYRLGEKPRNEVHEDIKLALADPDTTYSDLEDIIGDGDLAEYL